MSTEVTRPLIRLRLGSSIRTLDTPQNAAIALEMNNNIDLMEKYKPYAFYTQSLRSKLTNWRGKYKLYGKSVLDNVFIYKSSTPLGDVQIRKVPSMSSRREFVDQALERMRMSNIDESISVMSHTHRNVLDINTDALKKLGSVISKQREIVDAFEIELNNTRTPDLAEEDAFIATAIAWIRNNAHLHQCYLKAYNSAKDIFKNASTRGTFPRMYEYKGVIFTWKDIRDVIAYNTRVTTYLLNRDPILYDNFQLHLNDIRTERNETRIMFSLDDYDYDVDLDVVGNTTEPHNTQTTII